MLYIYVLVLETNKYYVGYSKDILNIFNNHKNGNVCEWTRIYKPLYIEKIINDSSIGPEINDAVNTIVKQYMAEHGISNVRGGSFEDDIDEFTFSSLQKDIWVSQNKCSRCGRDNHLTENCFSETDIDGCYITDFLSFPVEEDSFTPDINNISITEVSGASESPEIQENICKKCNKIFNTNEFESHYCNTELVVSGYYSYLENQQGISEKNSLLDHPKDNRFDFEKSIKKLLHFFKYIFGIDKRKN